MLDTVFTENLAHTVLVGVGDEHLPEMILPHHVEQFGNAGFVELVEDVIQQQNGFYFLSFVRIVELGQAQSQGV